MLIEHLRREGLRRTELARAQVSTIRLKPLKIAARVPTNVRRVVFHLPSGYPYQQLLRRLIARLVPTWFRDNPKNSMGKRGPCAPTTRQDRQQQSQTNPPPNQPDS